MKKTWLWLLAIALLPSTLLAQAVQPTAMYISSTGTIAGPWQPFMAAAGSESLGYVPVPGSALYYSSTGLKAGPWFPCTLALCFGGSGGGAAFTPTGIQYATSPTAASVVTPTQMFAAFSTQSANCFFAGPTTGSAATPTCRAMVVADLPTAIPNANLQNPSTTVNGQTCTLGSSCTIPPASPAVVGTAVFNGTGGIANATYKGVISSVTYGGAGTYTVNFSTLPAGYTVAITAGSDNAVTTGWYLNGASGVGNLGATSFSFTVFGVASGAPRDSGCITVIIVN